MKNKNYKIKEVKSIKDIPKKLLNTPIGSLLKYNNLKADLKIHGKPELIIVKCIDSREKLNIPPGFAYIIREPAARIVNDFSLSFTIGYAGVKHVAIIGHTDCKMVDLFKKKKDTVKGLVSHAGWDRNTAQHYFDNLSLFYSISDENEFVLQEANQLKVEYPLVNFVPLQYDVKTSKLSLIQER